MVQRPAGAPGGTEEIRNSIVDAVRNLTTLGLNRGTSGNVAVRLTKSFLVTPSGVPAQDLLPDEIVEMDFLGTVLAGGKPSSEWRIHRDILLARAEINAVVHTHSRYATTLACLQREVPAFHYMIAAAGGDCIRCTPYALFGSQELSDLAVQGLTDRKACLLGNHGMLALGADLSAAVALTIEVESLCEQYWSALQIGEPKLLSDSQMQAVMERFKTYGQRPRD
jgi:L-fuculose-phosphate aldolase